MSRTVAVLFVTLCLVALLAMSGCASFEGKFENEVTCVDEERMTFTSWWLEWLGISAKISARSAKQHCGKPVPIILQMPRSSPQGSGA